jgi:hypothetical protein
MTSLTKKRDRKITDVTTPKASPNKRDLKQQRSEEQEKEMKEKDAEMVDSAESETSKALLTKFDKVMTVDWKEWISKDSVT